MTTTDERCEQLQAEIDRCRGLVRMLGVHDFSALEDGIRQLGDGDRPLEFTLTGNDVERALKRIETAVSRLHDEPAYRAALPFEVEIIKIALAILAARVHVDPLSLLGSIETQFLQAMKEKH